MIAVQLLLCALFAAVASAAEMQDTQAWAWALPRVARVLARHALSGSNMQCTLCADEIDAIGTKRYESQSGGEREIQRTMLELLNQMDGFDSMGDVKVRCPVWVSCDVGAAACTAGVAGHSRRTCAWVCQCC